MKADPVQRLLNNWQAEPSIGANICALRDLPARPPQTVALPQELHPALARALGDIQALYTHQAMAWEAVRDGQHVMIVTGAASGKTLCYNLPILDRLARRPQARALYLFPTKALAQDQAMGLKEILKRLAAQDRQAEHESGDIQLGIYDGDTPPNARRAMREKARLLFSNPDMLHLGILPYHTAWADFFRNLAFVVIDEAHIYRGVFGSHVANVIRRLKRIAQFYAARPQFILASATIGNPQEFGERLVEERIRLVDQDGSARGPKKFLIYNPELVDPQLGLRRSALQESVRLVEDLLAYDIQTIVFGRTRRSVELILTYLRQKAGPRAEAVRGYRGGYLPAQRREIERGLRSGQARAVIATNALELGIDIGGMGAAVLVGYPGAIAAAWQQAGRAGRGQQLSMAALVAAADPLDQFLAAHPDYLFEGAIEQALINPDNLLILLGHLRCAAFELPFQAGEGFGGVQPTLLAELLEFLQGQGVLHRSGGKFFWMADEYPAQSISLRSASSTSGATPVLLQTWDESGPGASRSPAQDGRPITIGQVDQASACWMAHPQAVYMHEAIAYLVEQLDLVNHVAWLKRAEVDYYTTPRSEASIQVLETFEQARAAAGSKAYGEILVTSQVTGFRKVKWYTHETLAVEQLDLPASELLTSGYWLSLDEETVTRLREEGLWSNDPNDYGPGWAAQRQRARARDGYRCQVCGAPEQGRSHDVHHKTPFRWFTSAEQANHLDNLVTLCPACHRRAESAVRVRSGLAGLAYILRHLAPFFLMCDVGDLGAHTDPQAPFCAGSPAVVIYERAEGGIGFSQRLFELHDELMGNAYEAVAACACQDGCPSCVGPGGESGAGGKTETLAILQALRGAWQT
ncbi:MAG: DEAD/DEAH box helicase [Anaerolineales bacterium]|nr:DEAD/DEAH box helicase [Anaerolineales bacterium]